MTPTLSILICRLIPREVSFYRLMARLAPQTAEAARSSVEILTDDRDPPVTTGAKRQALIERATGQYVAFIDDDDLVSADYIPRILAAAKSEPDVIGIEGEITFNGLHPQRFVHSMRYDAWSDSGECLRKTYYRCPNHLNPVRRELALKAGYPDQTREEDRVYSLALRPLLRTEVFLSGTCYYYYA